MRRDPKAEEPSEDLQEQIKKLNRIGIALSSEHDLKNLLELIVKEARAFTNADGGSLYIRERGRLNFLVAQTESLQRRQKTGGNGFTPFYLPLNKQSIAGYVALTGELLNIPDAYTYPFPPELNVKGFKDFDSSVGYRTRSMLVVPMRDHRDETIGVLQLINSLDEHGNVVEFRDGYEDLVGSLASQAAVAIQNAKLIADIKQLFRSLVRYSAKAIDSRSPHTAGHSGRVAKFSVRIAEAINETRDGPLADVYFSADELEELRIAGWLHDIGKIGVRESVLEKADKLTDDRFMAVETRYEVLKQAAKREFLLRKIELLENGSDNGSIPDELEEELLARVQELEDELEFLRRVNKPGWLPDEDLERLGRIRQCSYIDSSGQELPHITEDEFENLSIRKGNLTDREYKEIQDHVVHTLGILEKVPFTDDLANVPKYAAGHHEMLNGSGYPLGLTAPDIPLQARIMCVADIFDALSSSDRPYKKAIPLNRTLDILREEVKMGRLDGNIVDLFVSQRLYEWDATEDDEGEKSSLPKQQVRTLAADSG